jgi:hyperosmotically inducible protein
MIKTLQSHKTRSPVVITLACAITFIGTLAACSKTDDGKTLGEKVDAAVAKTEQIATDAKNKAESSVANAGDAMKSDSQKAEDSSKKMAETVTDKVDDMTITASVSMALAKDPDLSAIKINVDTKDGKVTLNGPAPSVAAKEKATTLAKGVKGVSSVDNMLVVKS